MAGGFIAAEIGGVEVLVETVHTPGTEPTASRRQIERVQELFVDARAVIEEMAVSAVGIAERVASRARHPDQIEVQFGLKFSAQGKVIVANAGAEASLAIKIIYSSDARDALQRVSQESEMIVDVESGAK